MKKKKSIEEMLNANLLDFFLKEGSVFRENVPGGKYARIYGLIYDMKKGMALGYGSRKRIKIDTVGDLYKLKRNEIWNIPGAGKKSLEEMDKYLVRNGLPHLNLYGQNTNYK